MDIVIKIIGIVIILIAIGYLAKPDIIKMFMAFFKKGNRIYIAASLRFILAIVFLLAARECHHPRIVAAFGILFIIAGLLIIILGPEKVRKIFDWYLTQPPLIFRVIALLTLIVGAIILYAA